MLKKFGLFIPVLLLLSIFIIPMAGGTLDWIGATVVDKCGDIQEHQAHESVDGELTTWWQCNFNHKGWIIYDLGEVYTIQDIQMYQQQYFGNPVISVSNDPNDFGSGDIGRYVKVEMAFSQQNHIIHEIEFLVEDAIVPEPEPDPTPDPKLEPILTDIVSSNYFIYTDGTDYFARNEISLEVEYSGSSASWVTQEVVDDIEPNGGGRIFYASGEYIFTETVYVSFSFLDIEGSGLSTKFIGDNIDILFKIENTEKMLKAVNFMNLQLNGSNLDFGLYYSRTYQFHLTNVLFKAFKEIDSVALFITTDEERWLGDISVINCHFTAQNAIRVKGDREINALKIIGGNFFTAGDKTNPNRVAIDITSSSSFSITGVPNIEGYSIGVRIRYAQRGFIEAKFEKCGTDVWLGEGSNDITIGFIKAITDYTIINEGTNNKMLVYEGL